MIFYEKSYHKSVFLREVSSSLELDIEVIQDDVFKANKLKSGTVMARAFKIIFFFWRTYLSVVDE